MLLFTCLSGAAGGAAATANSVGHSGTIVVTTKQLRVVFSERETGPIGLAACVPACDSPAARTVEFIGPRVGFDGGAADQGAARPGDTVRTLSLIHISEPTRPFTLSRMPSSA